MVAFTGVLTGTITLGDEQVLIYNKVLLNVGNGYNIKSGHFVAPVSGIYSVSVSLMGFQSNSVHLQLVKDGKELVRLWTAIGSHRLGAQTIAVQLRKNEAVWVRRRKETGGKIYGGEPFNTFSVVLVASGVYQ
ncbi:hypothetical protein FSP39_001465 [Pinctada imbricata]|uniref:C1q domain-containing protein n=1 Tax=Pinctada imbricata TaxID=66713 RepID=A0AA88XV55_PINIB|nr:hypothetical protein FSP39_001465 [Pinctada imbricata]